MATNKSLNKSRFVRQFHKIFEPKLIQEIVEKGVLKRYGKGEILLDIGDNMTHIPLIIKGLVKVLREDQNEDEMLLYFLEKGDTCAISFINCINLSKSIFRASVEEETECLMLPVNLIEDWLIKYKSWRIFIIDSYHNRLLELGEAIRSLAFLNLDDRLIDYLKKQVELKHSEKLSITHQEIANDLHTSRVVISRLLKTLEHDGKIKLGRNKIDVLI
ncbi:Crp/Fnr family transcriptional regulator [Winogradskyella alexanderae]|uniref:Crp/Fnr family transcriptional regulator n=1 Tax=Winogradskyella alexanderae TaxID=2877123 RepID=A0ABS7XT06_9FLAO|nr:Crp/Fnr family transcriptional regulator [Winogradskyella alexanderae]MCA0133157.1 Crp/Fnr family transcriptional regulator [Winogradskyella alexanderae]